MILSLRNKKIQTLKQDPKKLKFLKINFIFNCAGFTKKNPKKMDFYGEKRISTRFKEQKTNKNETHKVTKLVLNDIKRTRFNQFKR